MKKAVCIILLFISITTFASDKQQKIDSLQIVLEKSSDKQWVKTAIGLASELESKDAELSQSLLDRAIENAQANNYNDLLGDAYSIKGNNSFENNKVLSGITYYQKAFKLFQSERFDKKAAQSLFGIAEGLSKIRKTQESIDTLGFILNNYRDSLDVIFVSDIFHLISNNYLETGATIKSIAYMDSAIEIEKSNQLLQKLANTYNNIGIIYLETGDYKNAFYFYDKCEAIANEIQDTLLISYSLHNKALIYLTWGVYDDALDLFLKAKNITKSLGKDDELALSLSSIASVYHEIRDEEKAKYYYLESIKLAKKYDDFMTQSVSLHNLGELYYTIGKYDTALILLNQSMKIEMEHQNTLGIAESKNMIATVYIALGKYPLAFEYFKDAELVFNKFGSKSNLASLYMEMGKGHSKLGNDSLSIYYFDESIKLANQINARVISLDAHEAASKNFEKMGKYKEALSHYKTFKEINDSIFNENTSMRLDYLDLRLEKQEAEKELESLENEKKLLKAKAQTQNLRLLAAIGFIIIIFIFFSIMYFFIKRSEKRIKQQYQILLESEQKIKALLDASFDSTILVDKNGEVQAANNNNLSGFLPEVTKMINKPILPLFDKTNQKVLSKYIELVYSSKLYKELRIHEKSNIVLNIKISPVQDTQGKVVSVAFYIQDITEIERNKLEKKKIEEQLIQTQKMETVGTLAGGIAHDFNNYLATIKGYVSMALEDSEEGSGVQVYLERTLKAVDLSQQTVKKLLAYSRSNDMEFNKISFDQMLNDSLDIIKGAKPKNIDFIHDNPNTNLDLLGETNQLTQVLLNICTNAFHAIEAEKGGKLELKVESPRALPELGNKEYICIKISDNGIGMKKETQERIFEPFFTTKDVGKGTGLGLSVVAGIIKQHGGKIEVHSEFGKGSVFYIYLPIIS